MQRLHDDIAVFSNTWEDHLLHLQPAMQCLHDDIAVFSNTWDDHLLHLQTVMQRLHDEGLTVKIMKCQLGMKSFLSWSCCWARLYSPRTG